MKLTPSPRGRDAARQELQLSALPRLADMNASSGIVVRRRSPLAFFLLVFALSVPFWLVGAVAARQALPGLPVVDALIVVCPLLAASMLVYRENGAAGVRALLTRAFDYARITPKLWYVPAVLLMPAATFVAYELMRVMDLPLPTPHVRWLTAPVLFLAFLIGAACKELGWTAYATDALQARWTALETGIVLGVMCAAWHIIPLVQIHRSPAWIAWWSLWTVAGRILIVWLYNNAGRSVFAAMLFHASMNVSWQLFPNSGSHWDPRMNGLTLAFAAAVVTVGWRPRPTA